MLTAVQQLLYEKNRTRSTRTRLRQQPDLALGSAPGNPATADQGMTPEALAASTQVTPRVRITSYLVAWIVFPEPACLGWKGPLKVPLTVPGFFSRQADTCQMSSSVLSFWGLYRLLRNQLFWSMANCFLGWHLLTSLINISFPQSTVQTNKFVPGKLSPDFCLFLFKLLRSCRCVGILLIP